MMIEDKILIIALIALVVTIIYTTSEVLATIRLSRIIKKITKERKEALDKHLQDLTNNINK